MQPSINDIETMTDSYLETAEWADKPEESTIDAEFDSHSRRQARADCESFAYAAFPWLAGDCEADPMPDIDWSLAGHNFYLSRCGHGAGFFDCDEVKPYGDILQSKAEKYGNVDYSEYEHTGIVPNSSIWLVQLC